MIKDLMLKVELEDRTPAWIVRDLVMPCNKTLQSTPKPLRGLFATGC